MSVVDTAPLGNSDSIVALMAHPLSFGLYVNRLFHPSWFTHMDADMWLLIPSPQY